MDYDAMIVEATRGLPNLGAEGNNEGTEGQAAGGTPAADAGTPPAEPPAAAAPPADLQTPPAGQAQSLPAASAAAVVEPPAAAQPQSINYEGISGGLIKSVDDITRISGEYATQKTELDALRLQVAADPFANDFTKQLNQMFKEGKTKEQISLFYQLTELGDISQMNPLDAMVQAKVLRDGRNSDLARRQIEMKYEITPDIDPAFKEVIEANMKDDAKADYEYLQSQKKELTTPAAAPPETAQNVINVDQLKTQVGEISPRVQEQFKTLGQVNINGKVDKDGKATADAILFDIPIPAEFNAKLPSILNDFFVTNQLPVTKENMEVALDLVNLELFKNHGAQIIQASVNHALAEHETKIRAEYENNGFVKKQADDTLQQKNPLAMTAKQFDDFAKQYVGGN